MTIRHGQTNKFNHPISWNFGDVEGYQFAGTGTSLVQDFEDPTTPGRYWPRLYYTLVKPLTIDHRPVGHDGKFLKPGDELCVHAVPMISNFDAGECTQDKTKYKWDYVEDLMKIHNMYGTPPGKLKSWLINQPDGMDVNYWYGTKADKFLITTWSQGEPTYNLGINSSGLSQSKGMIDNGYDLAPSVFRINNDPVRGISYRADKSSWYRGGCLLDVKAVIKGVEIKRTFMVCYDIAHDFFAFPLSARNLDIEETENIKQGLVKEKYYIKQKVPWPDYIKASEIGKDLETQYRPDWAFSHDGKKAVCVAQKIDEPWSGQGFVSTGYNGDGSTSWSLKESTPCLVEIGFDIAITGDKIEDFTFNIKKLRTISPETGRCIVTAEYAVKDFKEIDVKADDLIILEYEMFIKHNFKDYGASNAVIGTNLCLVTQAHKKFNFPNLATKAKVKNIKLEDTDGIVLFEWLANYSGIGKTNRIVDSTPIGSDIYDYSVIPDFKPILKDWYLYDDSFPEIIELPVGDDGVHNSLSRDTQDEFLDYRANIQSLELSTLSFVIAATLECRGHVLYKDELNRREVIEEQSISGVVQEVTVFGIVDSLEYKGYPDLSVIVNDLLHLNTHFPDLDTYDQFNLLATISGQPKPITPFNGYTPIGEEEEYRRKIYGGMRLGNEFVSGDYGNALMRLYIQEITFNLGTLTTSKIFDRVLDGMSELSSLIQKDMYFFTVNGTGDRYMQCTGSQYFGFIPKAIDGFSNGDMVVYPRIFDAFDKTVNLIRPGTIHFKPNSLKVTYYENSNYSNLDPKTPSIVCPNLSGSIVKGDGTYLNYPMGKIYATSVIQATVFPLNHIQNQLRTHPNGSWAIFTTPLVAPITRHHQRAEANTSTVGVDVQCVYGSGNIEYEQLMLDKIHCVYESTTKEGIVKFYKDTSHIEMFNKSFLKEFSIDDYQYKLKKPESVKYHYTTQWIENYGDRITSVLVFVGSLSFEKKVTYPKLEDKHCVFYTNGYFELFFTEHSCVFSEFLFSTYRISPLYYYYNYLLANNTRTLCYAPMQRVWFETSFYGPRTITPKIESLFYYANPYIDREENRNGQ